MANSFFPNGGNGSTVNYDPQPNQIKPGSILPLFDAGYLTSSVESDGQRYVRLTEKGLIAARSNR